MILRTDEPLARMNPLARMTLFATPFPNHADLTILPARDAMPPACQGPAPREREDPDGCHFRT